MTELAEQVVESHQTLQYHLDWLATPEARSAELFGFRVGGRDHHNVFGAEIFDHASKNCVAPLARGYIRSRIVANRSPTEKILEALETIEKNCPQVAIDLTLYGGDAFNALQVAEELVSSGRLPAAFLFAFASAGHATVPFGLVLLMLARRETCAAPFGA